LDMLLLEVYSFDEFVLGLVSIKFKDWRERSIEDNLQHI
jgi:hypothetical protein